MLFELIQFGLCKNQQQTQMEQQQQQKNAETTKILMMTIIDGVGVFCRCKDAVVCG